MTLEELKVVITAETSGLKKELNSLKTQLSKTEKTVTKTTSGMKKALSSLTKGFTATAIVYGLIKVGKQAVQTASDLQEVQNVVEVSFGSRQDVQRLVRMLFCRRICRSTMRR